MKLTWRDGVTTALAVLVGAVAVAVVQDLDWPLLGSTRSAIVTMGILGYAMCMIGIRGSAMTSGKDLARGPFMIAASVLGAIALVLAIVGLVVGTETMAVLLAVDLLVLWMVATLRHLVEGTRVSPRPVGAA
jgi:hypothetical protein